MSLKHPVFHLDIAAPQNLYHTLNRILFKNFSTFFSFASSLALFFILLRPLVHRDLLMTVSMHFMKLTSLRT